MKIRLYTLLWQKKQTIHSADLQGIACDMELNIDMCTTGRVELSSGFPKPLTERILLSECGTSSSSELHQDSSLSSSVLTIDSPQNQKYNQSKTHTLEDYEISESKQNSHILYQGQWYHINKFVSWEQGKFYMPKQSRLNRFYSNYVVFDRFIPYDHDSSNANTIRHGTVTASWQKGEYVFGIVRRILKQSLRGKSAFPLFSCKIKENSQDTEFAVQKLLPMDNSDNHGLSKYLSNSKHYTWTRERNLSQL